MSEGNHSVELRYDLGVGSVDFELSEELYPRQAVYGAAYIFVDRCFVMLSRPGDGRIGVRLKRKGEDADEKALEALAGEFGNELLNQLVRMQLADSTAKIREYYLARAFFPRAENPTIEQLLEELDDEEEGDTLDIQVPWQDAGQQQGGKKDV